MRTICKIELFNFQQIVNHIVFCRLSTKPKHLPLSIFLMNINYQNHIVKIFTHPHRSYNFDTYVQNHKDVIGWSNQYNCEGMLCSTSGYDAFDPWVWAQYICEHTSISPFIAINPIYVHPFAAARKIFSLSKLYNRKIYINCVTGSAQADLNHLHDSLTHAERYERMGEYIEILQLFFASRGPVSFEGKYYTIIQASLEGQFDLQNYPELTIAGESENATKLREQLNLPQLQMLPSDNHKFSELVGKSVALGIIVRPTTEEAWEAANQLYPNDRYGQKLLKMSMVGNQTDWKERLNTEMQTEVSEKFPQYWLGPFKNKYADCPYLVGSYEEIKEIISKLCEHKIHSMVLTIKNEQEFEIINNLFRRVEK